MIESILFKQVSLFENNQIVDILVKHGKIIAIEPYLKEHAELIINEKGLHIMPGAIDVHVHFRDPGLTHKEDFYTGSKAAAAGGITSFFDMPNTKPSTTTLSLLEEKRQLAAKKSLVNYNFFMGATPENIDDLKKAQNIAGVKIYVGSSTGDLLVSEQDPLERIFKEIPHLIAVHSEAEHVIRRQKEKYQHRQEVADHPDIRSVEAAVESTKRVILLAKKYKHRTHICHLSTEEEVALLQGLSPLITTEVTPQHLFKFSPDCYLQYGSFAQMNPPIREQRHAKGLMKGLKEGVIGCIATDHAPHTKEEKKLPFGQAPSGIPGVETSLPLLLNLAAQHQCQRSDILKWMCHNPARYFNIQDKGFLKVGYDADLVLVDLKKNKKVGAGHSKCGWSLFEEDYLTGWPIMTFVNGQLVFREGEFFETIKGKEVKINRLNLGI